MSKNFTDCLELVLKHEGGFVNHPKDPGGMTNLGVTKKVWEEWKGHPVTEKDIRELTPERWDEHRLWLYNPIGKDIRVVDNLDGRRDMRKFTSDDEAWGLTEA